MAHGNFSSSPVEQVVEVKVENTQDLPTALRIQPTPEPVTARRIPTSSSQEEATSPIKEIIDDYDPDYAQKQRTEARTHHDRTQMWLMAQKAYIKGIWDITEPEKEEPVRSESEQPEEEDVPPAVPPKDDVLEPVMTTALVRKKTVRFSEAVKSPAVPRSLPSKLIHQESAYYRAFTDLIVRTSQSDAFVNRLPRFEALQSQRVSLRSAHRNQLLGKYQLSVVPLSAKKRMSTNVVRGDDKPFDDPAKLRADKEADALSQMALPTWHVAALKLLNGGRLIAAPVHKRLARQSVMATGPNGEMARDRARILDLGGHATCDWAWHASLQYPNTKIYSVTTKAIRQLSNSHIRGPPNHRQVAVESLARLPFGDAQFDLVRAAELHSVLKLFGENGADEWEGCMAEIYRVLKPGGYIEFSVLDSDIMNAGPLGNAKNVEFGFALKTLGYDPTPTRLFLGRLQRAGFESPKRAWISLPVGPKHAAKTRLPTSNNAEGQTLDLEAMVSGSTNGLAAVTGLAAGWSWERWMLRSEMEKVAGELRLADIATASAAVQEAGKGLDGVHDIIEEGRSCGASFRMLKGYARKPRLGMGVIDVVLDM